MWRGVSFPLVRARTNAVCAFTFVKGGGRPAGDRGPAMIAGSAPGVNPDAGRCRAAPFGHPGHRVMHALMGPAGECRVAVTARAPWGASTTHSEQADSPARRSRRESSARPRLATRLRVQNLLLLSPRSERMLEWTSMSLRPSPLA